MCIFFFKQKTAYEMRISDWSSDVCSSDLGVRHEEAGGLSSTTGEGVEANVGERRVAIGNEKMMRRIGISDENWLGTAQEGRAQGRTVMFVAIDGAPGGLLTVADPIDRKSVVSGTSGSVRVDLGGSRIIKKKTKDSIYSTQ